MHARRARPGTLQWFVPSPVGGVVRTLQWPCRSARYGLATSCLEDTGQPAIVRLEGRSRPATVAERSHKRFPLNTLRSTVTRGPASAWRLPPGVREWVQAGFLEVQ